MKKPRSPRGPGLLSELGLEGAKGTRKAVAASETGAPASGELIIRHLERATRDGFWPDTISSDITGPGRTFRVFDLPTIVSKFLMLGMPLNEAIACVTSHAAASMPAFKDLGTLRPGAPADIAVLELRKGTFEFVDNIDGTRTGRAKLVTSAVVMNRKRDAPGI